MQALGWIRPLATAEPLAPELRPQAHHQTSRDTETAQASDPLKPPYVDQRRDHPCPNAYSKEQGLGVGVRVRVSVPSDEGDEGASTEVIVEGEAGELRLGLGGAAVAAGTSPPSEAVIESVGAVGTTKGGAAVGAAAGLVGAAGLRLVRPLLCMSRLETASYCAKYGLHVWEDTTNADIHTARRNRVRIQVRCLYLRRCAFYVLACCTNQIFLCKIK